MINKLLSISILILSTTAQATNINSKKPADQITTVQILKSSLSEQQIEAPAARKDQFSLNYFAWKPTSITVEDRTGGASSFEIDIPRFSFFYQQPLVSNIKSSLYLKSGLGFQSFKRSGNLQFAQSNSSDTQNLYILPLHGGFEFQSNIFNSKKITPFVGAWVSPTWISMEDSMMSDSKSYWTVFYETNIGATYNVTESVLVDVGFLQSFGKDDSLDFQASGFNAGIRASF